jgi:hypothetical protein
VLDALLVGGSAGVDRIASVGLGQPFVLTLSPPVGAPSTLPVGLFALWAHLGLPPANGGLPLGPGAGSLCFTPAPLAPFSPTLLVADSFGLGGFVAAGPAPWTLGFPGVPALLDVTLQAAMAVDLQGHFAATNAMLLRVVPLPAPTIAAFTPTTALGGQTVTVQGTNFLAGIQLTVAGVPTPILTRSSTLLTFSMPQGLGCDVPMSLGNLGSAVVTRTLNATPIVTGMPFAQGPAAGGVLFALTGTNLAGCTVTFNGVPMTITSQNATSIVGMTPPGAPGQATVVIRNSLGCQAQRFYTYL